GQRYEKVEYLIYLGGKISSIGDAVSEVNTSIGQAWKCFDESTTAVYNQDIALAAKVHFLKAVVVEITIHGRVTWNIALDKCGTLREAYRGFLLRCLYKHI
ncbi:unnamed protein product, partial [Sphacelaria rigidula]